MEKKKLILLLLFDGGVECLEKKTVFNLSMPDSMLDWRVDVTQQIMKTISKACDWQEIAVTFWSRVHLSTYHNCHTSQWIDSYP